jgi:hypothetical protein
MKEYAGRSFCRMFFVDLFFIHESVPLLVQKEYRRSRGHGSAQQGGERDRDPPATKSSVGILIAVFELITECFFYFSCWGEERSRQKPSRDHLCNPQ